MNVLAMSAISVKVRRHLLAVVAAWILIVSRSKFQCHCFLLNAGAPLVAGRCSQSRALLHQVESSKLSAGNTGNFQFGSPRSHAVSATFSKQSFRSPIVTSYRSARRDFNTSTNRLEVEALTAFKAAITSDPMGALKSWQANDSSVCGWVGVVCSPQQHGKEMHLITLNVSGDQLVGNLNSALLKVGNLVYLQQLDLSNNVFSGSIPSASIGNCSKLSYLSLSNNRLTGPIPSQLGELVNLKALDFEWNNLTGNIPESLGNCTLLKVLNLGRNFFDGEIPPSLGRLYALEYLNLAGKTFPVEDSESNVVIPVAIKSFSGSIPSALGNCSSLIILILQDNTNLGGQLPQELGRLTKLKKLILSRCRFQGTPLSWLGNITSLSMLDLGYNEFHGEMPDVMGTLQDLIVLYLGGNNLTGVIPVSITNCTSLTYLGMERNRFTGDIPSQLGLLGKLEEIVLEDNSLTGILPSSLANCSALTLLGFGEYPLFSPQMIPSWMGSLVNLELLYLASMNLQGGIPEEIGRLSKLQTLGLDDNNLTGMIPPSLANCTSLNSLALNLNELTGEIPSEIGLLTDLQDLVFDYNFFIGPLPTFFVNLTQIQQLSVSSNALSGTVDVNLGRLQQLNRFTADGNEFIGSIPETLSNCSQLFQILLMNNRLTGEIPASFGNLTRLEELGLSGNKIGRMIPVDIARCSKLGSLDLSFNNMEGNIPPNIGQLFSLRYLDLNNNNFSGVLPTSLGNCSNIIVLDCSYNHFIGSLPGDIFSTMSKSLTTLQLSHNFFSGYLSPVLSRLANIQIIDVAGNNISGSIPPSFGDCKALVSLDISINNLTGVIPQSIGRLPVLKFFNASYNNFEGPIPEFDVLKANVTNSSFLGNPLLCGIILGSQRECRNDKIATSKSCNGFTCKKVWLPTVSAGCGILLIVVGVLCWMTVIRGVLGRKSNQHSHLMLNFAPNVIRVSEKDVLRIIDGGEINVIGGGAKSVLYRGVLSEGGEVFAVKTLPSLENGLDADEKLRENELLKEVHTLAKLRHRNILKVLSYCSSLDVKAMILEYMPEGSLHNHLYELAEACPLTWEVRLNIAMGVAEAMKYLHHDSPEPFIHRDLKPSNILLDANLEAKVADFGISKSVGENRDGKATASTFCGTIGYMPPEYATGTLVSTKGDVYSYGVILLELLVGRPPTSWDNLAPGNRSLQSFIIESFEEEGAFELLDSTLKQEGIGDTHKKTQMMLLMRVALDCTHETPGGRPCMNDVVEILTKIKNVGMELVNLRTLKTLQRRQ